MRVDVGLFFDSVAAITNVRFTLPLEAEVERTRVMIGLGGVPFVTAAAGVIPIRPTQRKLMTPAEMHLIFIAFFPGKHTTLCLQLLLNQTRPWTSTATTSLRTSEILSSLTQLTSLI